jgi:microcystin-dependent protein
MGINLNHQTDYIETDLGVLRHNDTGGFVVPQGNSTTQRPSVTNNNGLIRYNTSTNKLEAVINGVYVNLSTATDVTDYLFKTGDSMTGVLGIIAGTAALPGIAFAANTSTGIYQPSTNVLGLSTAGVERMRISSTGVVSTSGNVGIGTSTPGSYALNVVKDGVNQACFSGSGTNGASISLDSAASGKELDINFNDAGTTIWAMLKTTGNLFYLYDRVNGKAHFTAAPNGDTNIGRAGNFNIDASGNATTLTQTAGDNTTRIATTAFVTTAVASALPVGSIISYAANSVPSGYHNCNGAAISRTTYAALFAIIGTTYGVGDNSKTFNLPDFRGQFIRGFDAGRGVDTGRVFGSTQVHSFQKHTHAISDPGHTHQYTRQYYNYGPFAGSGGVSYSMTDTTTSSTTGITVGSPNSGNYSSETRPTNIAVTVIIKY